VNRTFAGSVRICSMIFLIVAMNEWFHYWNHSVKSLRHERL
jgi:hypothetical protein